jgi:SPOR domain
MVSDIDEVRTGRGIEDPGMGQARAQPLLLSGSSVIWDRNEQRDDKASIEDSKCEQLVFAADYLRAMQPDRGRLRSSALAALVGIAIVGGAAVILIRSDAANVASPAISADSSQMQFTSENIASLSAQRSEPRLNDDRLEPDETFAPRRAEIASGTPIVEKPALATAEPPRAVAIPSPPLVAIAAAPSMPAHVEPNALSQAPTTGSDGGVLVQVSSLRSEAVALTAFNDLQRRYPNLLGDRKPNIQRANLDGRGVYYRVRVNFPTRGQAVSMCENLKGAGGDCFIVER